MAAYEGYYRITWTNRDDEPGDILFTGPSTATWSAGSRGQEGFHEVFCRRLTQPSEVYAMRSSSAPRKLFAVNIDNFVPKSIHFGAMRGNDREILVFGGRDGKMRSHFNRFLGDRQLLGALGNWRLHRDAVVDTCIGLFVLTIHKPTRQVRYGDDSKSSSLGATTESYTSTTAQWGTGGQVIVEGSGLVQTIATADCNGVPTIFVAKSGRMGAERHSHVAESSRHAFVHALGIVGAGVPEPEATGGDD
ncbi:hypothetical protein B0H13DRAFT_2375722 [Mycena leptocephala]|nr:hypothetical protein B0H13DRAFT_2375722 [Mycena leptocephala]